MLESTLIKTEQILPLTVFHAQQDITVLCSHMQLYLTLFPTRSFNASQVSTVSEELLLVLHVLKDSTAPPELMSLFLAMSEITVLEQETL